MTERERLRAKLNVDCEVRLQRLSFAYNKSGRSGSESFSFAPFPPTPPYVPFGIRRFRTLLLRECWLLFQIFRSFGHYSPTFQFRCIIGESALSSSESSATDHGMTRYHSFATGCAVRSFPLSNSYSGTSTSADFSWFVVTA